ncbi:hypothetical protein [Marinobacter sp.]|uniref:hypothetical protein n=1 Tax=Marinobacter sp. TaxID=50741 RepID=UPI002353D63B|nr:hypothetical protein [Marinobacter sp.]
MFVFKVKKGINQVIKVSERNFINATRREEPFYQTVNDKKRHYAYCPACENPVMLIHVHVDNQVVDEDQRTLPMHARHVKYDVLGLGEYDQAAYDTCPYANPSSSTSKKRREQGAVSDELLWLVKTFPDAIDTIIRRDVGIAASEKLFLEILTNFKEEEGHLYRYVSKPNLPYSFMYMADSQNLLFEKLDTNYPAGRELRDLINESSRWCAVSKFGIVYKKKDVKGYVQLKFHFTDFEVDEIEGEKYQKFYFVVVESCGNEEQDVLKKEIKFDHFYFQNIVEKRLRFSKLAKGVLGD